MADDITLKAIGKLPLKATVDLQGDGEFALQLNNVTYKGKLSAVLNGEQTFDALTDTPDSKTDNEGKVAAVDSLGENIEYVDTQEYELLIGSTDNDKLITKGYFDENSGGGAVTTVDFIPQSADPDFLEGRVYYNDNKKAFTGFNDQSDISLNFGEELIAPIVINNTGSQIDNGTPVYLSGVSGDYYEIDLADCAVKSKCRKVYIATQNIANGTTGRVTKIGETGDLNLSAYDVNDLLYLSSPSGLTDTTPDDGKYITQIGLVKSNSDTDGILYVDVKTSDTTVEVTDTNGFPTDQREATTISFVDATRTFTIAPTGDDFHFYELGDKFEKTTSESITITDVNGVHAIYYNNGTLTVMANPTTTQFDDIILKYAFVAILYWNSTDVEAIIVQDERHGLMQPIVHEYLHDRFGAFYKSGLALEDFIISTGSLNSHAQFGNALGVIADEDISHNINAVASTVGLDYLYRTGASGIFSKGTNAGYSFPVGSTPLPQFNEWTGSTWQLTELTSGYCMNIHLFANGDITGNLLPVIGTDQYSTGTLASAGQANELTSILGILPLPEFVLIGTVIIAGKTSYTNTPNARVIQNSEGEDYTNWTETELSQGAAPSNHNNLAGLQTAATGVTFGHVNNSAPLQLPELTTVERDAIPAPNAGMVIYNTTEVRNEEYDGVEWKTSTGEVRLPVEYIFDDGIIGGDPGSNNVAFDNADLALVTKCYISKVMNNKDFSAFLNLLAGTGVYFEQKSDTLKYIIFITDTDAIDQGTYLEADVTVQDSGTLFDAGETLATNFDYAEAATGGGGHTFKKQIDEGSVVELIARAIFLIKSRNGADVFVDDLASLSSIYTPVIGGMNDFDRSGENAGDVVARNASDDGYEPQATAIYEGLYNGTPEANISADGILSMIIPAGYKIENITITEDAGNAAGNISIGSSALGTDIVNAQTVGASGDVLCTLGTPYFSRVNDTDLYISSSAWGTGIVTIYITFIQV